MKADKREDAVIRARDLFWAKGYHATSLKDLEATLDMRPGSIYAAFDSKEKLFLEALERYAQAGAARFADLRANYASPLAALAAHIRSFADLGQRDEPARACMMVKTVLEAAQTPALSERAEALLAETEARFIATFSDALAAGEIAPDSNPAKLGRRYMAEIGGLRAYAQRPGSSTAVAEMAEDIAREVEALRVQGDRD
ncbi:TetR/AcrR family transcriptional regulator [Tropicimonas sp. S265A]|uniref:TetR/AcrR family transcriptional regulator n=1 Tax=Tropicimonas sp. S265A TaxID=3415134 RepID=UPI003C7AE1B4